jgi:hypothetical protein
MAAHLNDIGKLRLFAAAWFGAASCIPLIPVWMEARPYTPGAPAWYNLSLGIFLAGVLPVFVAGMFGYSVGARILSSTQIRTAKQSVVCGLKVALFSFSVFAPVFSLLAAVHLSFFESTPGSTFLIELLKSFFGALLMVIIMGGIILGWLIALVAATAGWMLYKIRSPLFGLDQGDL